MLDVRTLRLVEFLRAKGFSGRRHADLVVAIIFRSSALAHLVRCEPVNGWIVSAEQRGITRCMPSSSGRRPRRRSSKTPIASLLSMCVTSHAAFSIWRSLRGAHESLASPRRRQQESRRLVTDFLAGMERIMRAAGATAIGDYNALSEILSFDKPTLIIPRQPRAWSNTSARARPPELGFATMLVADGSREPRTIHVTSQLGRRPLPPIPPSANLTPDLESAGEIVTIRCITSLENHHHLPGDEDRGAGCLPKHRALVAIASTNNVRFSAHEVPCGSEELVS